MSFWQILGRLAISNDGETIQRVSDETFVSNTGVAYTQMGPTKVGTDGSVLRRWAATVLTAATGWGIPPPGGGLFLMIERTDKRQQQSSKLVA